MGVIVVTGHPPCVAEMTNPPDARYLLQPEGEACGYGCRTVRASEALSRSCSPKIARARGVRLYPLHPKCYQNAVNVDSGSTSETSRESLNGCGVPGLGPCRRVDRHDGPRGEAPEPGPSAVSTRLRGNGLRSISMGHAMGRRMPIASAQPTKRMARRQRHQGLPIQHQECYPQNESAVPECEAAKNNARTSAPLRTTDRRSSHVTDPDRKS